MCIRFVFMLLHNFKQSLRALMEICTQYYVKMTQALPSDDYSYASMNLRDQKQWKDFRTTFKWALHEWTKPGYSLEVMDKVWNSFWKAQTLVDVILT